MPMTTELPVGDLYEFIGDFRLNGDGPPTTGRLGIVRLQELLLSSTSAIGARFIAAETNITALFSADTVIRTRLTNLEMSSGTGSIVRPTYTEIAGLTLSPTTTYEVLDGDTGNHTGTSQDVGYVSATGKTPNAGRYNAVGTAPYTLRRVDDSSATAAAKRLAAAIAVATTVDNAKVRLLQLNPDTNLIEFLSNAQTIKFIQDVYMPKTYASRPPGLVAKLTSTVVLPYDEQRDSFQLQSQTHDLAVNWYDAAADKSKDAYIYAGVIADFKSKGPGAVSVRAYPSSLRTISGAGDTAQLLVEQERFVPGYISGSLFADTVLSYYPDQSFSRTFRNTLRDRINQMNDQGKWPSKGFLQLPVHSLANATTNLLDPSTPFIIVPGATGKGLGIVPYKSLVTLEATAVMDTVKLPDAIGLTIDSGFYFIKPGLTAETAGTLTGNSGSYYLKPNAGTSGAPAAGFRNGSGAQDSPSAARGSLLMMNRNVSTDYDAFVEGTVIAKGAQRPGVTPGARSIYVGGNHSSNGSLVDGSLVEWRALGHMPGWNSQATALDWRTFINDVIAAGDAANAAMGA